MNAPRKKKRPVIAGSLLLAHPALQEETFHRTVIFMSEHNDEGSMGVILNRPQSKVLGEIDEEFAFGPLANVPVFTGGPVQTEQLLLAAWEVRPDGYRVHFALEPDRAAELLRETGVEVRAFFGYAGWTAGQLDKEMTHSTWVVTGMPEGLLEQDPDATLWRKVLGEQGDQWRLLAEEPEDTSLN